MSVPLTRFQVFDTHDPDELGAWLNGLLGRATLDLHTRNTQFHSRISHLALGDVRIIHGEYKTGLKVHFPDFNTFVGSPAPLKGAGQHEVGGRQVTVSGDQGVVLSPGGITLQFGPRFEHLSMAVQPAELTRKLAAIVGDLRLGPLRFDPTVLASAPQAKRLERLLRFVASEFEDSSSPMSAIVQSELQQAMMTSFLLANANNYSGLLAGDPEAAAPWQVRRAEEYIEANWHRPITVEELASATSVSVRSLFASFKAGRGYSPMDFVKRVRLGHAWQKLSRPDPETSVTAVVFACGFGNPGHFTRDYRHQYGEYPSETLKRGRGG